MYSITVLQPGMYTTIQDGGRFGYQRFGVPVAGAMDPFAYRLSNLLAGNPPGAAALELTATGPTLRFEQNVVFALAGADFSAKLDGISLRPNSAHFAPAGSVLSMGGAVGGFRSYLAVYGGLDGQQVMGSRSTYVKAGLGGYQGRPLQKGDRLCLLSPSQGMPTMPAGLPARYLLQENLPECYRNPSTAREAVVRVLLGAQQEYFSKQGLDRFFQESYTVTGESDRMGYRLQGPRVDRAIGMEGNILSDGVAFGSIQIPDNGQPIVMMADRQTTGGYPKLGAVITADLPVMAQLRAGEKLRFLPVTLEQAHKTLREQQAFFHSLEETFCAALEPQKREFKILLGAEEYTVEVFSYPQTGEKKGASIG